MNKPVSIVLAFDPDDAPVPHSRLSDELAAKWHILWKMPIKDRLAAIDQIWEAHRERR